MCAFNIFISHRFFGDWKGCLPTPFDNSIFYLKKNDEYSLEKRMKHPFLLINNYILAICLNFIFGWLKNTQ